MSLDEVNHPRLINFFRLWHVQHMGLFLQENSALKRDAGTVMSSGSCTTMMPSGHI